MFDLGVPPSFPLVQPVLPISHQPNLNLAEGGTGKIKVNPTQLSDQRAHPVSLSFSVFPFLEKRSGKTFVDSLGRLACSLGKAHGYAVAPITAVYTGTPFITLLA